MKKLFVFLMLRDTGREIRDARYGTFVPSVLDGKAEVEGGRSCRACAGLAD